jgi:REP element-mobilizing transposase RayT
MQADPVWLNLEQAQAVLASLQETAKVQGWWLAAVAIMPNHVHVVVGGPNRVDGAKFLGRFKSYASRGLNARWGKRNWWTENGSARVLPDLDAVHSAMEYVANQPGPLVLMIEKDR